MPKPKIMLVTTDHDLTDIAGQELDDLFHLTCLNNGEDALEILEKDPSYMALLSGLTLPGMNGRELLTAAHKKYPKIRRIMITGNTSFKNVANTVNTAEISKLLPKKFPPGTLQKAVKEAAFKVRKRDRQEADAMKDTLFGCVRMLVDILELTHPTAVRRSKRIRRRAQRIASKIKAMPAQLMDMVVLLSNIGCVGLPSELIESMEKGQRASQEDMQIYYTHPSIAAHLLNNVPRMDKIAEIIRHQNSPCSENPPLGARILKVCIDMDQMELTGASPEKAIEFMEKKPKIYDKALVAILKAHRGESTKTRLPQLTLAQLEPGMVMLHDMNTTNGAILLHKGEILSEASHLRLLTFQDLLKVQEPVFAKMPKEAA